jgi:hypothetical protein
MEAIALATLPREEDSTDSDSDSESMASGVSSTVSRRELTESGREGEPAQKGARRGNFFQFTSGTYEEDEYIPNTEAATHASTNTRFSQEGHSESGDSRNSFSKTLKEVSQGRPLNSYTFSSHPRQVPQSTSQRKPELKTVPHLDNADSVNPAGLISRTGNTDTPLPSLFPSAQTDTAKVKTLPRLSAQASNKIHEYILKPLLAKPFLKDFHPIVKDCPRRIHSKEIVCLRDLEKTLMLMAPVSYKNCPLI